MALILGKCQVPYLLKKQKMTQTFLADKVGVPKQTINKICKNKYIPPLELAENIAHVLHCTVDDLYIKEQVK